MSGSHALELVLPWPSKDLSPNGRLHWVRKADAVQYARQVAVIAAINAGWKGARLPDGRLHLHVTFYRPSRRRMDDDNLLSRFKPSRDGLAQVLGIDDTRFISHPLVADEVRKGGQVVVRITAGPAPRG